MNNHYLPRLLLRQFAEGEKVHTYDVKTSVCAVKKLKAVFSEQDLFDSELESAFASRLEGPFGNLLHHKLLKGNMISIDRRENLLMRKFLMINFLRSPIVNGTWEEMVERTGLKDHPSVQAREFLIRHDPGLQNLFDRSVPSKDTYLSDLRKAMEIDTLEEISDSGHRPDVSDSLRLAARSAMVTMTAFWDCADSGQEFLLPKLPGVNQMDSMSTLHKMMVLRDRKTRLEAEWLPEDLESALDWLIYGSAVYSENFSVYPLSPTRAMICYSPYFKAFFPLSDQTGTNVYPPLLTREQFDRHFYEPMRMELFAPCRSVFRQSYQYTVKQLTAEEVQSVNALMLDMETEEFVFHDLDQIRDSFWYYDHKAEFAMPKKHDFRHLE